MLYVFKSTFEKRAVLKQIFDWVETIKMCVTYII